MTAEDRFPARLWYQGLGALALAILVTALIVQLEAGRPLHDLEFVVDASQAPELADDVVTCQRRLPGVEDPEEAEAEEPEPLGRVTSTEVVECPDLFDGALVTYIGEVVGDVLQRDGGAWVLMNDDAYALETGPISVTGEHHGYNSGLSVWLEGELAELVDRPGGPAWRGDVLRVVGVVNRADPADGGGLTIRATEGDVVAAAVRLPQEIHWPQIWVAAVLAAITAGVLIWERTTRRRR